MFSKLSSQLMLTCFLKLGTGTGVSTLTKLVQHTRTHIRWTHIWASPCRQQSDGCTAEQGWGNTAWEWVILGTPLDGTLAGGTEVASAAALRVRHRPLGSPQSSPPWAQHS